VALRATHDCLAKCTGLYADVWYSEEDSHIPEKIEEGDNMLLNMLKEGKQPLVLVILTS